MPESYGSQWTQVKSDSDYKGYRFSIGNAHAPGGKFFAYGSLVKGPDCAAKFEFQEGWHLLGYIDDSLVNL